MFSNRCVIIFADVVLTLECDNYNIIIPIFMNVKVCCWYNYVINGLKTDSVKVFEFSWDLAEPIRAVRSYLKF